MPMKITQHALKPTGAARNFFFYFLNFVLLYLVAEGLGGALFFIIHKLYPVAADYYASGSGLRYHLAALIIATPIFLWISYKTSKDSKADPMMRFSTGRRWLTYIALIIAALAAVADLIVLVFNLIGGEPSLRFLLKVAVVLAVAGCIFYYYLWDVRTLQSGSESTEYPKSPFPRLFFMITAVAALVVIVSGFFFIESPQMQAKRNNDQQRVNQLNSTNDAIRSYASNHNDILPTDFSQLSAQGGLTLDPVTKQPFTYEIVDKTNYKLCATFETSNKFPDKGEANTTPVADPWIHPEGYTCFDQSLSLLLLNQGAYPAKVIPIAPTPSQ